MEKILKQKDCSCLEFYLCQFKVILCIRRVLDYGV